MSIEFKELGSKKNFCFKGVELSANPEQGIIMSTQSLVLQGVNRNSSGEYSCQESDIFLTFIYRDKHKTAESEDDILATLKINF